MFSSTDGITETEKVTELKEGGSYSQGNHETLMKFLSKLTGKEETKVETIYIDACTVYPIFMYQTTSPNFLILSISVP